MTFSILRAETAAEIDSCYACMAELRPHLSRSAFIRDVSAQQSEGYQLIYCADTTGEALACAGYRINRHLAYGRVMYVDDLVTKSAERSVGYGNALMSWLRKEAISQQCAQLHLDSGVQRYSAHKFYFREGMNIASYHFVEQLAE